MFHADSLITLEYKSNIGKMASLFLGFVLTGLKASEFAVNRGLHYEDSLGKHIVHRYFVPLFVCRVSLDISYYTQPVTYQRNFALDFITANIQAIRTRTAIIPIVNDKRDLVTDQTAFD